MSLLTKILIVLVAVMSILLTALVIPFVANTQNFKQQLDAEKQRAAVAEAKAQMYQSEVSAAQEGATKTITDLSAEAEGLRRDITRFRDQVASERAIARRLQDDNTRLKAESSQSAATLDQMTRIFDAVQQELAQRREEMLQMQSRSIELADRNNELESQNETFNRQVRRFKEQVTDLEQQIIEFETQFASLPNDVRERLAAGKVARETPFEPDTRIAGSVLAVESIGPDTFVKINIGANDGVEPNMQFMVHRDTTYLGTLLVTSVDTKEAAGRIVLREGAINSGDGVLTGGF